MALWSTKRRIMYGGGVILIIVIVVILFVLNFFYKSPTCRDGVRNGDEKGIDCGGSCPTLCTADTLSPVILWSKIFNISGDVYSAVAYVENPNVNSENKKAEYQFKIFDSENRLITARSGVTTIPKNRKFAIFETGIILKNSKPKSTDFKFTSFGPWIKDTAKEPEISIKYGTISSATTAPKLTGTVVNKSLQSIPKIELVVLVLDDRENAMGVSRTFIDDLQKNTSQDFVFTWQKPFVENISVVSIIHRFIQP